ncbi:MAG TPA: hypothetical protein VF168_09990 [Trueperaceae bacterium]
MFEESPDGFISRWRQHAAAARVFSRTEGLPLLEVEAGGAILQVLERTGPYLAQPGEANVIINPTARTVELHGSGKMSVEVAGIGRMSACGQIIYRDDPFLVVDVGAPVVLGVIEPLPDGAVAGAWVSFESIPPIHGFVVPTQKRNVVRSAEEAP